MRKKKAGSMYTLEGWGYQLGPGSQTASFVPSSLPISMQHPFFAGSWDMAVHTPFSLVDCVHKKSASRINSACWDQLRAEITWLKSLGM